MTWYRIKNNYAKLRLLLQSGQITEFDLLSNKHLRKYMDGRLNFLDTSCTELTDADLPLSVHKWGTDILNKIKTKNIYSSQNQSVPEKKLITHNQIKAMLLYQKTEKKNALDIDANDVHYLQRTIQKIISYKLSELINNNDSPSTSENQSEITKSPSEVILIDSDSEDNIVDTTLNENTTNKHDTPENNKNNNLDSWEDDIPLATWKNIDKLRSELIVTDDNSIKESIDPTSNNESMEGESSTISTDASEEKRKLKSTRQVMNFNIEVKVEHDDDEIKTENTEEDIANKCTINESDEESEKINMGLDRGVIVADNIKKENLVDSSTDESMEVELESKINENYEREEIEKINRRLHSEVLLKDDIKEENFADNSSNESMEVRLQSKINENYEREEIEKIKRGLHSEVILEDDIKEENFVDSSADESMEVELESTINKNVALEKNKKLKHSNLLNESEQQEEMSDYKVLKFFSELGVIMSDELSLEKQEELKFRINEVITARLLRNS